MTKLLDKAIEAIRGLAPEEQDKIAEMILAMAVDDDNGDDIAPEDLEASDRGLDDLKHRRFATDEEVEVALRKFDSFKSKDQVP